MAWNDTKGAHRHTTEQTIEELDADRELAHFKLQSAVTDELLAALEALYAECNPKREDWHLVITSEGREAARAAIARAKGGAQ